MELLQLKYFQTVARLEHMTRAAEQLRVAQPSLSKTISRLEEDLGVPLFDRHGRQIQLNSFGRAFLQRVERAFMELDEGQRELRDLAGLHHGTISLALSTPRVLPELLGEFLSLHPDVHLRQFLEPTASMKRQLETGEIDMCISSEPIDGPDIEWKPLITEEIFLIVPPEHPLAGQATVDLAELKEESFISMNEAYGFRNLTDGFCRTAGFIPNIAFEGDEPDVIGKLVRQGLGVAFVPALSWLQASNSLSHRLRIENPMCQRTIGLAWSKRRYFSQASKRFHDFVIGYFANLSASLQG